MANHRQVTTQPTENATVAGSKSNQAAMKKLFAKSPLHDGSYTPEIVKAKAQELLLDSKVNDGGHTFGEFNRDYTDAPNLEDVQTGGGGLPATPYVPNPASPGEGVNADNIPDSGYERQPTDLWGSGVNPSQRNPSAESAKISAQKIGDLPANRSSQE